MQNTPLSFNLNALCIFLQSFSEKWTGGLYDACLCAFKPRSSCQSVELFTPCPPPSVGVRWRWRARSHPVPWEMTPPPLPQKGFSWGQTPQNALGWLRSDRLAQRRGAGECVGGGVGRGEPCSVSHQYRSHMTNQMDMDWKNGGREPNLAGKFHMAMQWKMVDNLSEGGGWKTQH